MLWDGVCDANAFSFVSWCIVIWFLSSFRYVWCAQPSFSLSVHDSTAVRFLHLTHAQHASLERGTATLILTRAETTKKGPADGRIMTAKKKNILDNRVARSLHICMYIKLCVCVCKMPYVPCLKEHRNICLILCCIFKTRTCLQTPDRHHHKPQQQTRAPPCDAKSVSFFAGPHMAESPKAI